MRTLLEVLSASAVFIFGWCSCVWSCSRRVDCPKYLKEQLRKWTLREAQKLHERHPTPPGGKAA